MTPRELNSLMVDNINSVLEFILPNGTRKGHEWCVGSVDGEPGKSLMVNMSGSKAGVWKDFAADGTGGDLIDLWCAAKRMSFVEAMDDIKHFLNVTDTIPKNFRKKKTYKKPEKPQCTCPKNKMVSWFANRGIKKETLTRLKIAQKEDAIIFPYLSPAGDLELIKYRSLSEKKFWSNQDPIPCLFGWQAVSGNDKDIVICEGEIDCLSFWEQGIPSLSVPKGAGGGGKQDWIEYEFERLERFANIFICMDGDEAGQIAKNEIIDRLGRHRCQIVNLQTGVADYKDPNEVHLSGWKLVEFLNTATTEDPEELKPLTYFHDEIINDLNCVAENSPGIYLPWDKLRDKVKLRPGEVTVWGGINSHGKSVLLSHVVVDAVSQGARFCIASMEMKAEKLGNKMYRQVGWDNSGKYNDKIRDYINDNVWIFNSYGTAKASRIMDIFDYARRRYGIKQFVIDSLAKCGFGEDDYNKQKDFVDRLAEYAMDHSVHIHLVVHVKKKEDEFKAPGKFDIKGTGAIVDMVDNAFIVWRNKKKEEDIANGNDGMRTKPDTVLNCVKQRETGVEPIAGLWFNPYYCQFVERLDDPPKKYVF